MSRIIFSIFNDNVNQNHKSTNDYKLSQFRKYKDRLYTFQKHYADKCDAEYILHDTPTTDYNTIQFEKILLLEKYADHYDKVVYFDFDIVPTSRAINIFESVDFNTIGVHPLRRNPQYEHLREAFKYNHFDTMNVYCKTCAVNSMLSLEGISAGDKVYNTGVVTGGRDALRQIKFKERLQDLHNLLDEAREDSLYPEEISKNFYYNNEVYMTYLIAKYKIPFTDLGMQWNFILDGYQPNPTDAAYLLHHVNKEFEKSFG